MQAGGSVVITQGLTYEDAKAVALDVAKSVYADLAPKALEVARERAEQIADKYLGELNDHYKEGIAKANDPGFQRALHAVQVEFASTGDEELGDLLVQLLVDRTRQDQRNIMQIVLSESLTTAAKLTSQQLSILALAFVLRYSLNRKVVNNDTFGAYLDEHVRPFLPLGAIGRATFQHLEYAGCGSIQVTSAPFSQVFLASYTGLFAEGFDWEEIERRGISIGRDRRMFTTCVNDPSKAQVNAMTEDVLAELMKQYSVPPEDQEKIKALFNSNRFDDARVKSRIIAMRPYMAELFSVWDDSDLKAFTLTSVGMAIGHANLKRLVGEFGDLAIWVN